MAKLDGLFTIGDKAKEKPGIREQLKTAKKDVSTFYTGSKNKERKVVLRNCSCSVAVPTFS